MRHIMAAVTGPNTSALALYCLLTAILIGVPVVTGSLLYPGEESFRDIWQHYAAIDALRDNIYAPQNPFVTTSDSSRHFHPFWLGAAVLANALGLSTFAILGWVGVLSGVLLAVGIHAFARAFSPSPSAPAVLLILITLGWSVQLPHTGFPTFVTLLYGIAYPATILIGLSLLLWAFIIRSFEKPLWLWAIIPLTTLMVTTHQLGAMIGLTVAGCFILCWPETQIKARIQTATAVTAGLALAALWPYHNPYRLILAASGSTWELSLIHI